jgi:DNA replication protein DnaC
VTTPTLTPTTAATVSLNTVSTAHPFHQLATPLKRLRLSGILDTLEVRTQQAIAEQWSYTEFVTRLIQDEVERRSQKQLDLRLRRSGLNTTKTLETFDFTFNPGVNRQQVLDLATCTFVHQHRNVLVCGQTGVGKSHLAQALAHEAARQGFAIAFTTAHQMLLQLHGGRADGTYDQRLARYTKPDLLVLDDFGLKPLPPAGPADLYDVIDDRYERRSIVLTSNRAPHEWPELFGNPLLANAALDRLAHRAIVVTITGRSYRLAQRADGKPVALFEPSPPTLPTAPAMPAVPAPSSAPTRGRRAANGSA